MEGNIELSISAFECSFNLVSNFEVHKRDIKQNAYQFDDKQDSQVLEINSKMSILLICGAGIVSGKEIMSLHLLRELKARGHNCYCVSSSWGSEDFRNRLRELGISFFVLRIGFISKTINWSAIRMTLTQIVYLPVLYLRYIRIRNTVKPDVTIHTNFHHLFLLYPILSAKDNIYWSHEIISDTSFYKKLFHLFDHKVSSFVAVSEAVAASLRSLIGNRKIRVIKNGTTLPMATGNGEAIETRFTLAIIGQVSGPKGHEILLRALSDIPKDKFMLRIVGAGDPDFVSYLKSLIEQMDLKDNCIWSGFVSSLEEIYQGVDAVIVPSIFPDPYPTTVMEAGLRGIPVVVSTIGGLPEMVIDGINGFFCEAGNVNELRQAIIKIIDYHDPALLRKQVLDFALRNFDIGNFADNFEELIIENHKNAIIQ